MSCRVERDENGIIKRVSIDTNRVKSISKDTHVIENAHEAIEVSAEIIKSGKPLNRLSDVAEEGRKASGEVGVQASLIAAMAENQQDALEIYAKEEGLWFEDYDTRFGERIGSGQEQMVYRDPNHPKVVTKVNTLSLHESPLEFFDRIAIHNSLFKEAPIKVVGFTSQRNRGSALSVIVEQPYIDGRIATKSEISNYLAEVGFREVDDTFISEEYVIDDAKDNAFVTNDGKVIMYDEVPALNTEEEGLGGTQEYGGIIDEAQGQKDGFVSNLLSSINKVTKEQATTLSEVWNRVSNNIAKRLGITVDEYRQRVSMKVVADMEGATRTELRAYESLKGADVLNQTDSDIETKYKVNTKYIRAVRGVTENDLWLIKLLEHSDLVDGKKGGLPKLHTLGTKEKVLKEVENRFQDLVLETENNVDDYLITHYTDWFIESRLAAAREANEVNDITHWRAVKNDNAYRDEVIRRIRTEQKTALQTNVSYLKGNTDYSIEFRYLTLLDMLSNRYSLDEKGEYQRQSIKKSQLSTTEAPFQRINPGALSRVYHNHAEKGNRFIGLSHQYEIKNAPEIDQGEFYEKYGKYILKENEEGIWLKFNQTENVDDAYKLYEITNTSHKYPAQWCTGGSDATARGQLFEGDFYVFVDAKTKDARVAVRYDGSDKIGEMRGLGKGQSLLPQDVDIVNDVVENFPDGKSYQEYRDVQALIVGLENKSRKLSELTLEQLISIRAVEDRSYGERDALLNKYKQIITAESIRNRFPNAPYAVFEGEDPRKDILNSTKPVYYLGSLLLDGSEIPEGFIVENVVGDLDLRNTEIPDGFTIGNVGRGLYLQGAHLPEGFTVGDVGGDLELSNTKIPDGFTIGNVGGVLDLSYTKLPEGFSVGDVDGGLYLQGVHLPEGFTIGDVGGSLILSDTKIPEGFTIGDVGGYLELSNTEIPDGFTIGNVGGGLYLRGAHLPEGFTVGDVGGGLDLSNTEIPDGFTIGNVGGGLDLSNTEIPDGFTIGNVGGDLDLSYTKLPEGFSIGDVGWHLDLSNTEISEGFTIGDVGGSLILSDTKIPEGFSIGDVGGHLDLSNTEISEGFSVGDVDGGLYLQGAHLPEGFTLGNVGGGLDLSNTEIPEGFTIGDVGGYLDLSNTEISEGFTIGDVGRGLYLQGAHLPDGFTLGNVGGDLNLTHTKLPEGFTLGNVGGGLDLRAIKIPDGFTLGNVGGDLNLSLVHLPEGFTDGRYTIKTTSADTYNKINRDAVARGLNVELVEALEQKENNNVKGRAILGREKTVLLFSKDNADVTTVVHEIAHEYEKALTDTELTTLEEWSGAERGTVEFSEAFAKGAERYIYEGTVGEAKADSIFKRLTKWFRDLIADAISYFSDINELNDGVREIYTKMLADSTNINSVSTQELSNIENTESQADTIEKAKTKALIDKVNNKNGVVIQLKNSEEIQTAINEMSLGNQFYDTDGTVYGFYDPKTRKVVLNQDYLNRGVLFHELDHHNEMMLKLASAQGDAKAQVILDKRDLIIEQTGFDEEGLRQQFRDIKDGLDVEVTDIDKKPREGESESKYIQRMKSEHFASLIEQVRVEPDSIKRKHKGILSKIADWVRDFYDWLIGEKTLKDLSDDEIMNLDAREFFEKSVITSLRGEFNPTDIDAEMQRIKDLSIQDGSFMKAPNGNLTNLNERQWLQVRTKEFKEWFGDWENDPVNASKVVDENGEPLVVYHGTDAIFTEFDTSEEGVLGRDEGVWDADYPDGYMFFTNDKTLSTRYGRISIPLFLNLRFPEVRIVSEGDSVVKEFDDRGLAFEGEAIATDGELYIYGTDIASNIKSATDNVGTFRADNNDIRFSIIGEKGATNLDMVEESAMRIDNLAIAREMEKDSNTPEEIRFATGWERGADGKWRYEILDGNIKESLLEKGQSIKEIFDSYKEDRDKNSMPLPELFESAELYKAYPSLNNITVSVEKLRTNNEGSYQQGDGTESPTIVLSDKLSMHQVKSVLVHEIQHAIQGLEGFAKGSSKSNFRSKRIPKRFKDREIKKDMTLKIFTNTLKKYGLQDYNEWWNSVNVFSPEIVNFVESLNNPEITEELLRLQKEVSFFVDNYPSAYEQYRRTSGEVEARNVEKRLSLSFKERRKTLLKDTEDVSRKDQIFLQSALGDKSYTNLAGNNLGMYESVSDIPISYKQELLIEIYNQLGLSKVDESQITYTNEEGNICAMCGLRNTVQGSGWKVVRDFKGKPSHSRGGYDIILTSDGVRVNKGGKVDFKAEYGLAIPNDPPVKTNHQSRLDSLSNKIVEKYKHFSWVKRALHPEKYPFIKNSDGTISTHKLAYGSGENGEFYVFPTIVVGPDGNLVELDDKDAFEVAKKNREIIVIDDEELADYFSRNGLIKH